MLTKGSQLRIPVDTEPHLHMCGGVSLNVLFAAEQVVKTAA